MNVLLIDSDADRRHSLRERIRQMGHECHDFSQVNGLDIIDSELVWKDIEGPSTDLIGAKKYCVLLIHHNNNQNPFWEPFVHLFCSTIGTWTVSYSGGLRAASVHERHHPFAGNVGSRGEASWDLAAFLKAVENEKENPFNSLTRFDPVLEAKLELLHTCLTPPKSRDSQKKLEELKREIGNAGINLNSIMINAQWGAEGTTEQTFSGNLDRAISALTEETDCFSAKYVAILSEIRDKLLVD